MADVGQFIPSHSNKAWHKISTPSLIFHSSTLPASQLLAIGFYNLSLGSEELLPLSMKRKGCYSLVTISGPSRF